jgi:acyl-CoA synthetase (AMP-forming)/AMP-acid ligase II
MGRDRACPELYRISPLRRRDNDNWPSRRTYAIIHLLRECMLIFKLLALPRNNPGEIILRSPGQMIGYAKNLQASQEVVSEIGIRTGDLGYLDDAGRIVSE